MSEHAHFLPFSFAVPRLNHAQSTCRRWYRSNGFSRQVASNPSIALMLGCILTRVSGNLCSVSCKSSNIEVPQHGVADGFSTCFIKALSAHPSCEHERAHNQAPYNPWQLAFTHSPLRSKSRDWFNVSETPGPQAYSPNTDIIKQVRSCDVKNLYL